MSKFYIVSNCGQYVVRSVLITGEPLLSMRTAASASVCKAFDSRNEAHNELALITGYFVKNKLPRKRFLISEGTPSYINDTKELYNDIKYNSIDQILDAAIASGGEWGYVAACLGNAADQFFAQESTDLKQEKSLAKFLELFRKQTL